MKTKIKKLLTKGLTGATMLPLVITPLSSCSKSKDEYAEIANKIEKLAISEFIGSRAAHDITTSINGVASIARPTFYTHDICEYLENRIKQIMGDDIEILHDKYNEIAAEKYQTEIDQYGTSMCFDIPATNPNMPSFILQAHTDMVWKVKAGEEVDTPNPEIVTENGKTFIHTKGEKSSLGADDGIGIGMALAIAGLRNEFQHGKIRIFFTTDEEAGISSASCVPCGDVTKDEENWFYDKEQKKFFQYILNADLENPFKICRTCEGTVEGKFEHTFDTTAKTDNLNGYKICVSGLAGGHSALDIPKGRKNAIKIAFELLQDLLNNGVDLQLREVYDYASDIDKIPSPTCSMIPDTATIFFCSSKDLDFIQPYVDSYINILEETVKGTDDQNLYIYLEPESYSSSDESDDIISSDDTENIINFICNLPYGSDEKSLTNLGSARLNCETSDSEQLNPGQLIIHIMGRTYDNDTLGNNPDDVQDPKDWTGFMKKFHDICEETFDDSHQFAIDSLSNVGWTPMWLDVEGNGLVSALKEGAKKFQYDVIDYAEDGWVEIAYFDYNLRKIGQQIPMSAIGFKLTDVHTPKERLYLDSVNPTIHLILYAMQNSSTNAKLTNHTYLRKEEKYE